MCVEILKSVLSLIESQSSDLHISIALISDFCFAYCYSGCSVLCALHYIYECFGTPDNIALA